MAKTTINNFTGGLTDHVRNSQPNQYITGDNLLLEKDGGLRTRFGSQRYNSDLVQPVGADRIDSLIVYNDKLLAQKDNKIYDCDAATSTEITGGSTITIVTLNDQDDHGDLVVSGAGTTCDITTGSLDANVTGYSLYVNGTWYDITTRNSNTRFTTGASVGNGTYTTWAITFNTMPGTWSGSGANGWSGGASGQGVHAAAGGAGTLTSSSHTLSENSWYYLEVKHSKAASASASANTFTVQVTGADAVHDVVDYMPRWYYKPSATLTHGYTHVEGVPYGAEGGTYSSIFKPRDTKAYTVKITNQDTNTAMQVDSVKLYEISYDDISSLLNTGTTNVYLSKAEWNKHLLMATSKQDLPTKLFYDGTNYRTVTCGLPKPVVDIDYASQDVLYTGSGSQKNWLYRCVRYYQYEVDGIVYQDFSAPSDILECPCIFGASYYDAVDFTNGSENIANVASNTSVTAGMYVCNINEYIPAGTKVTARLGGATVVCDQAAVDTQVAQGTEFATLNRLTWTPLTNGTASSETTCYDLYRVMMLIYRTKHNDNTFYFLGSVPDQAGIFIDKYNSQIGDTDDIIDGSSTVARTPLYGTTIYTTGGILGNDQPPKSKFLTVANDIAWYGNIYQEPRSQRILRIENAGGALMQAPLTGDLVFGSVSGAQARLESYAILSGVFTSGTAEMYFYLTDQVGTFVQGEDVGFGDVVAVGAVADGNSTEMPSTSTGSSRPEKSLVNRVRQSVQFDPDSCPETFYIDVEGEIVGMSAVGIYPIVLTRNKIYRLDGYFDELGRGNVSAKVIDNKAGCLGNQSIVQTETAIYWAGNYGWYATDGFTVKRLTENLTETYRNITSATIGAAKNLRITGAFDRKYNRILWGMYDSTSSENTNIYVYDIDFGVVTSRLIGESSGNTKFEPTAIIFHDDLLTRGTSQGYLFKHTESLATDETYNGSAWKTRVISYSFKHIGFDFGQVEVEKWCSKVTVECLYQANASISLQLTSYDNSDTTGSTMQPIRFIKYGTADYHGYTFTKPLGYPSSSLDNNLIVKSRHMPSGNLRTRYKQLGITNPSLEIWDEGDFGTLTITGTTTCTTSSGTLPSNIENYYLTLNGTSVGTITSRDGNNQFTIGTPATNGAYTVWGIYGNPKGEIIKLKSFAYEVATLDDGGGNFSRDKETT